MKIIMAYVEKRFDLVHIIFSVTETIWILEYDQDFDVCRTANSKPMPFEVIDFIFGSTSVVILLENLSNSC